MTNFEYMSFLKIMRDKCDEELARMNKEVIEAMKRGEIVMDKQYIPTPDQLINLGMV